MDSLTAWRQWRSWLRVQNSGSPNTVRSYAGLALRFLAETDCLSIEGYREDHCAAFLAEYAPRGSARHEYAKALRSFFGWAAHRNVILVDPMQDIHIKKPRRVAPVVLTLEKLTCLLVAAVFELGERAAWAILLVYLLGLRRIEATGLKWEHIRQTEDGPVIDIRQTKGGTEREALPLSPLALECLARLRDLPSPPQAALGPEYILRVRPGTFSKWVHQAGVAAGLNRREVGSHRLRASLATHLLRGGVDVRVVQQVLGHLRLESTAWYLAAADGQEVRAALSGVGLRRAG